MRILRSIVLPLAPLMATFDPKVAGRGAVRSQIVRHQPVGEHRVFLEKLDTSKKASQPVGVLIL
jgi:hypothetical protein